MLCTIFLEICSRHFSGKLSPIPPNSFSNLFMSMRTILQFRFLLRCKFKIKRCYTSMAIISLLINSYTIGIPNMHNTHKCDISEIITARDLVRQFDGAFFRAHKSVFTCNIVIAKRKTR